MSIDRSLTIIKNLFRQISPAYQVAVAILAASATAHGAGTVDVFTLMGNPGFELGFQPAAPGNLGIGCPAAWICLGNPYPGASAYLVTSAQYVAGANGLSGGITPGGLYAATMPVPVAGSGMLYQLGLGTYLANTTYSLTLWVGAPLTVPFCGTPTADPSCSANVTPAGPLETLRFYWLGSGTGTSLRQLKAIDLPVPPAGQWTSVTVTFNPSIDLVNGLPQGVGMPINFAIFAADNYNHEIVNIDIVADDSILGPQ